MTKKEIIKQKKQEMTREERRLRALEINSKPTEWCVCPLCGFNHFYDKLVERARQFGKADLKTHEIFTKRTGGGRGIGWTRLKGEGKTLDEMQNEPQFEEIINDIRQQAKKILAILGE